MKNKIQTVQTIFFVLLVILGFNAFTSPNQEPDLTEGKIEAVMYSSLYSSIELSKKDFLEMNLQFEDIASDPTRDFDSGYGLSSLSGLSQLIYLYEQRLNQVEGISISHEQRIQILEELRKLKSEFSAAIVESKK